MNGEPEESNIYASKSPFSSMIGRKKNPQKLKANSLANKRRRSAIAIVEEIDSAEGSVDESAMNYNELF